MKPIMTLLSQKEIDTLVAFLTAKRKEISNEVLSQRSVDKLIQLIRSSDLTKVRLDPIFPIGIAEEDGKEKDVLGNLKIREDSNQVCELILKIDTETDYIQLYAYNTTTKKEFKITPSSSIRVTVDEEDDTSEWGFSIAPIVFDIIASVYQLKYSTKVYEEVCARYALKNYGDEEYEIPVLFLPAINKAVDKLV